MKPLTFTLDGAPMSGTNSKRLLKRGRRTYWVPSKGAVEWRTAMVLQLRQQYRAAPLTDGVAVTLVLYRARNAGDVDNFAKPVLDALQAAGVLANDRLVDELHLYRRLDRVRPRVEITITLAAAQPLERAA